MKRVGAKKIDLSVEIFGVTISGNSKIRVLSQVWLQRKKMLHVATVNSEYVMEARANPRFREILRQSEINIADSFGVVWAAHLLFGRRLERITGVELVREILRRASDKGERVFLLGARPGSAQSAASQMMKVYPGARYAWYEGARSVILEKSEEASMTIAKINAFEPDYLLVAYGSPWQDIWIEENRRYLRARVAVGVGGVIDDWAGITKQCPGWLDRWGGKWLWRLVHEPWRWRRVWRVFQFGGLVIAKRMLH